RARLPRFDGAKRSSEVRLRRVQRSQQAGQSSEQHKQWHHGAEVGRAEICGRLAILDKASLALHPVEQGGRRRSLQNTSHGPGNAGLIDELQLSCEDALIVRIETHDESGQYPQTTLPDHPDLAGNIAAQILKLSRSLQRLRGWGLDADKHIH